MRTRHRPGPMSDEQRRAMFWRMNQGGGGGSGAEQYSPGWAPPGRVEEGVKLMADRMKEEVEVYDPQRYHV